MSPRPAPSDRPYAAVFPGLLTNGIRLRVLRSLYTLDVLKRTLCAEEIVTLAGDALIHNPHNLLPGQAEQIDARLRQMLSAPAAARQPVLA